MADFTIALGVYDDAEVALDWDRETKKWSRSEKYVGGQRWFQGMEVTQNQLAGLLSFFRIEGVDISPEILKHMSPGELASVHASSGGNSLYAILCGECGEHWYLYRWEEDSGRWAIYGRRCDYSWRRGDSLQDEDIKILARARSENQDPLSPPTRLF